jgi:phage terminase large subunit-like protein
MVNTKFNPLDRSTLGGRALREHVLNAVFGKNTSGYCLSKQKTSGKIDRAVALSFAMLAAIQHGGRRV